MHSRATLRHWWERLRVSWWLVPSACVAGAIGLSVGAQVLDQRLGEGVAPSWAQFRGSIDGARSVLSAIAASMMTFTGLVFSITVLVLQLASTQFSPRVLRTFLADRRSQAFLGLFVGTFVYSLLALANLESIDNDRITSIPVLLGLLLAVTSVVGFIVYIHHVVQSIRVSVIIRRVGEEAREALERLYPEAVGAGAHDEPWQAASSSTPSLVIPFSGVSGVVQQVDEESLFELAESANVTIALTRCIGDFVGHATPLFRVWGDPEQLDLRALDAALRVGSERSITQDAAFGFRELVDIAERALSPSLNDPTTAVQVLDQLEDLLLRLARRHFPSPARYSEAGALRLVLPRPAFDSYVRLALDEIRSYGKNSMQVARRLRALLDDVSSIAPASRQQELQRQRRLLDVHVQREFDTARERRLAREPSRQGHGPLSEQAEVDAAHQGLF